MRFGEIPLDRAEGALLAHTLRIPGVGILKKGRTLSAADVEALARAGHDQVIGALLDPGDVAENEAAARVAAVMAGHGISADVARTGRCNLRTERRGVFEVDRARVDQLNRVDEGLTFACVEPFAVVEASSMVATVKIIPFSVSEAVVEQAIRICGEGPLMRVAPLRARAAGLILTELPGVKRAVIDRASESQHTRLERLGASVRREIRCPHDARHVADAIRELAAEGCDPILLLGASAIVDRKDVIPAALVAAGGSIEHLGMPVDPGNLLLLGRLGPVPVVGVPGCARSLKPSGFDWVLRRILADIAVAPEHLTGMGVGGLLVEAPSRPQPRAGDPQPRKRSPRVGALVLAAGLSRRMGAANKLLSEIDGIPMVKRVVDAVLASRAEPVVVVTGHDEARVREALAGLPVSIAHNPAYREGLSSSLRVGLDAIGDKVEGAVVCLGDMPWVQPEHLEALLDAFDPRGDRPICVPVHDRKRGNPVLWPARHFAELGRLQGDVGGRDLLDRYADEVNHVQMPDEGVTLDVDTPSALTALSGTRGEAGEDSA